MPKAFGYLTTANSRHSLISAVNVLVVAALVVLIAGMAIVAVRRWQLRWGATRQEVGASLAGDKVLARSDLVATRAITIHAPAESVWPWIAQLGQGRGGFYSYDALENLAGSNIHSASRIVLEWQAVKVGDQIRLAPQVPLRVAEVERNRAFVLRGDMPVGKAAPPYDFAWAFVLWEQADGTTRLLVREHYEYKSWWTGLLAEPLAAISFVMTQRMLRGIRQRSESYPHACL